MNQWWVRFVQSLSIGAKAREAEVEPIVYFINLLEIGGNCLKINSKPPIASYGEAVLAHHGD